MATKHVLTDEHNEMSWNHHKICPYCGTRVGSDIWSRQQHESNPNSNEQTDSRKFYKYDVIGKSGKMKQELFGRVPEETQQPRWCRLG